MIEPETVIDYAAVLALVASLPIALQGLRRRGTGDTYESLFWVQRAPQIAGLLNFALIVAAFVLPGGRMSSLFAHLPSGTSDLGRHRHP